ncbi:MAG: PEP-CTERM sorting domain-containing protein [Azonexus sp.]
MKKTLVALALAAAVPVAAHATSYDIEEVLKFTATSDTATFLLSWEDLVATNTKKGWTTEVDGKYSLSLFDTVSKSFVFKDKDFDLGDTSGVLSDTFTQTFSSLVAGTKYRLNFSGSWNGPNGVNWSSSTPSVSVAMAPVPEPQSYAMFLAGLGIIGAIVRRKNI